MTPGNKRLFVPGIVILAYDTVCPPPAGNGNGNKQGPRPAPSRPK